MILLIWVSSKVRNFLRKCLRSMASPLCQNIVTGCSTQLINRSLRAFEEMNAIVDSTFSSPYSIVN